MKVFIAGARSISVLSPIVLQKMFSIYQKGLSVLVGDCYGVDASVQQFYAKLSYKNVVVYASNGKARNNIGHWNVCSVPVENNVHGFDFYKQKDIAMANEADYGLMIWNGESRGTLNNIINLVSAGKTTLVYLSTRNIMAALKNEDDLCRLIDLCERKTRTAYLQLSKTAGFLPYAHAQTSFLNQNPGSTQLL